MRAIKSTPVSLDENDGAYLLASVERIRKQRRYGVQAFATDFLHISSKTYQSWLSPCGGKKPSGAALSLLRIVAARPDVVEEVLGKQE